HRTLARCRPCHVFDPRRFLVEQGGDHVVECDHRSGGSIAIGRRALGEAMLCYDRRPRWVDGFGVQLGPDAAWLSASIVKELLEPSVENEITFGASGCSRY